MRWRLFASVTISAAVLLAASGWSASWRQSERLRQEVEVVGAQVSRLRAELAMSAARAGVAPQQCPPVRAVENHVAAFPPSSDAHATARELAPADHDVVLRDTKDFVGQRIATGVWTANDARKLNELMRPMSSDERGRVLSALFTAMNRGEVRQEYLGSSLHPFGSAAQKSYVVADH